MTSCVLGRHGQVARAALSGSDAALELLRFVQITVGLGLRVCFCAEQFIRTDLCMLLLWSGKASGHAGVKHRSNNDSNKPVEVAAPLPSRGGCTMKKGPSTPCIQSQRTILQSAYFSYWQCKLNGLLTCDGRTINIDAMIANRATI